MRRMLLTAIAIVAFISSAVLLHHAAAKSHTPPPVSDAKAADAGRLRLAANVCGMSGCVAVQVKRLDAHQIQKPAPKGLQQYMQQRIPARTPS
jgi:hypothetical protein